MPKLNDRERLAKLEADQRKLADETESVRRAVRTSYGLIASDLPLEQLTEREFREVLSHAIRVGGAGAVDALKELAALPAASPKSPERPPSDEHGGAARRRPAPAQGAASAADGAGR
jgi:hypothetical protein